MQKGCCAIRVQNHTTTELQFKPELSERCDELLWQPESADEQTHALIYLCIKSYNISKILASVLAKSKLNHKYPVTLAMTWEQLTPHKPLERLNRSRSAIQWQDARYRATINTHEISTTKKILIWLRDGNMHFPKGSQWVRYSGMPSFTAM